MLAMPAREFDPTLRLRALADSLLGPGSCLPEISYPSNSLMVFLEMLGRWSLRVDLVSPGSEVELFERHILDSYAALLMLFRYFPKLFQAGPIVDVGSGAGLPGLVFALALPKSQVILLEPREKRVLFLKEVLRKLELSNVSVVRARMEEVSEEALSSPSLLLCRALGLEQEYLNFSIKVLSPGGFSVQLLGPSWQAPSEIPASLVLKTVLEYSLPPQGSARKLAVWSKK